MPARDCGGRRGLAHDVGGRAAGERRVHFPERRESIVRFLLEAPHDNLAQPPRRVGTQLFKGQRLRQMQLSEHVRSRLAVERPLSGQHLVADHPERKNVGASVHIVADGLLRRHVPHRSERRPLTRQLAHRSGLDGLGRRVGLGLQGLGEPKVEDLHEPVEGHHDVAGFQVAMDDAGTMRAADGGGDLRRVIFYLGDRHVRAQQAREGPPVDVLHRDEIKTLVVIDLVDGDDVGMVERRGGLGFPEESFLARRRVVARIERENLECDVAIECRIARQPHLAHAALSERTLDPRQLA